MKMIKSQEMKFIILLLARHYPGGMNIIKELDYFPGGLDIISV